MKNKGFTLIEVLSIIIILGLIVVITVPVISSEIEKSKEQSAKNSALYYLKAVDAYYMKKGINDEPFSLNGTYTIDRIGNFGSGNVFYDIQYTGKKPTAGFLTYKNEELYRGCIFMDEYAIVFDSKGIVSSNKESCDKYVTADSIP